MQKTARENFTTALSFLTTFPVKKFDGELSNHDFAQSLAFFPLVGFCIGIALFFSYISLSYLFPNSIVTIMILSIHIILSRGLHIDGFADLIDGFGGGYTPEERLKIMKDTQIGTFGVCGIVLLLLAKFISLNNLSTETRISALIIMPVIGRLAIVFLSYISSSIQGRAGIGKLFIDKISDREFWIATISGTLLAVLFAGGNGILTIVLILTFCIAFDGYTKKKIGGVTGDVLGFVCEMSELIVLLIFTIFERNTYYQLFEGIWL